MSYERNGRGVQREGTHKEWHQLARGVIAERIGYKAPSVRRGGLTAMCKANRKGERGAANQR